MISKLRNPKTNSYYQLKEHVLSFNFPWHWNEVSVEDPEFDDRYENFGYYGHCFLGSPGGHGGRKLYSSPASSWIDAVQDVFVEILNYNNIKPEIIFRMHEVC